MSLRRLRSTGLIFICAAGLHADTTYILQNGVNGYAGAKDVSINTQYSQYNGGNGVLWRESAEMGCYTVTGSGSYTVRYLVKFDALPVPPGSQVVSATLTLGFDAWSSGKLTGYYLKNAWTDSDRIGWIHRDAANDWASPGASAAGVDTVALKSFTVPRLRAIGPQPVNLPLDLAVAQSWIDNPAANQGTMLVNNNPGEIIRLIGTTGTQSLRPKLTIVVSSGTPPVTVTVSPQSATLAPGGTQTFTANVPVTWTATGGTITPAGVYTAGQTAGSFQVKATSTADATKSATAAVTITAPPVTVTVSPQSATLAPGGTQTFTANVPVTWTATGGTITPAGVYTAGQTAGSFQVKATSTADATKSAMAAVTITAPPITVTVSPQSATLAPGGTQTFTANVPVTWTATGGTITSAGMYTAGQTAGSFQVKATSTADSTKSATAAVTITAPPITVTVSPQSATLAPGGTQTFTANVPVTWTATGGTITPAGVYTAGQTAGSFQVKATSTADSTKSATAAVTITAPPITVTVSPQSATLAPGGTQTFTANVPVTWTATGGTITSAGVYTAGPTAGSFQVKATSTVDSTKSATAAVTITSTGLPPVPRMTDGPYVVVQSPVTGMHFTAPATIRIYADPYDGAAPDPDALTVTFLMNGQPVGTFTGSGAHNGYFPLTVTNVAAGTYVITAQIHPVGGGTATSAPVTVFVDSPAASSGPVFNLSADLVLAGSQSVSYIGTPADHCVINGNGFQIRSGSGFTGTLTISNCDIRGLGTASKPAIDVTVNGSGSIQLTGNVFDRYGEVSIGANDQAQAVVRNNEFRENTLVPVGSQPEDASTETVPVFHATGSSSAQQYFQGNNVGLSTVVFENTRNWLIGGGTDAETNVLMGVRCGFRISGSSNMVLRGNYSEHRYPHRFSQGENFQLDGNGFLAEHNVIRSSSWPVRGMGGELRYNLIDASGNTDQVFQAPMSNARIHHNIFIFTVSQTFYSPSAGLSLIYNVDNVQFYNNVMDGGGKFMLFSGSPVSVGSGSFIGSLRNNVFYNFASPAGGPMVAGELGESGTPARLRYADYNDFYNPDAPNHNNYGLTVVGHTAGTAGYAMHDLGGFNGHVNPQFAAPTALPFPFRPEDIWSRTKKVSDVLATYRAMYAPASGSPLIGTGDPQDGIGGNIGAVGNGEATDQFGKFGNGSVTVTVSPQVASLAPGATQAFTANVPVTWTATGGTITSAGLFTAGQTAGSFQVKATSAADPTRFGTATVTITVPAIAVTVSPQSATVAPGGTQVFTANVPVTWTATGGTITSAGLYTAGQTAGSFQVKATSAADPTKFATAAITITAAPPVGITVSPQNVTLAPGATQTFTANLPVTWTATGGTITSAGVYTAGQTTGSFQVKATSTADPGQFGTASVTIFFATSSDRPRIILDSSTLVTLRSRMSANTAQWRAIKRVCDSLVGGTVNFPGQNEYPNLPNVGEGYQGSSYFDALMPLGICYQTVKASDPATAAKYGAKGVAILAAMSDPAHMTIGGTPIQDRDNGYGIRFYGVTMGIGYDWFHDLLTPALQTQVQNALNTWIYGYEHDSAVSFEYDHPMGNYFAGYYAAKCMAALAVQGDSPLGDTWWNDWLNNQHNSRLAPYFALNMAGGGWPEGFANYGPLATRNLALPTLAVRTAKGIDLIHAAQPYTFPLEQARWAMQFTWPSRDMVDDRDTVHSNSSDTIWPGTPDAATYSFLAGFLAMWNDPLAPAMHKYARDAKAALAQEGAGDADEWIEFLFWDDAAPEADYSTTNLSYMTSGVGEVAARSDWSNSATWMSFRSGPYVNNPAAGHQSFNAGSVALVRGKSPLLVNVEGWLAHNPEGSNGENAIYDDNFGNWDADHSRGNRRLYNTFQVRHVDASGSVLDHFGQWALQRSDGVRTKIGRYEDGGTYVLAVGQLLEDMYRPFQTICNATPVTSWSREVIYLRPSQLVVFDKTTVCNASLDQYLAFHFPGSPVEVAAATGVHRFDVNAGAFAGSMTTVLPQNAAITMTDKLDTDSTVWGKVWRTEVRPTGVAAASRTWLTVFDAATAPSLVAAATPVTGATGTVLAAAGGNTVVVFAGTATVSYAVPAVQSRHIVSDLTAGAGYTVTVTASGGNHIVTVAPGGTRKASANGVLTFTVTAGGAVQ
jgi:hypothetical protein